MSPGDRDASACRGSAHVAPSVVDWLGMNRTVVKRTVVGMFALLGCWPLACGGDTTEATTTTTTTTTGAGGAAGTECKTHSDCKATACKTDEAATTSCKAGKCKTECDASYKACSECKDKSECTFVGDLCPPPKVDPNQRCFDGKCAEFCGPAPGDTCATDAECPRVQCPGAAAAVGQCVIGGCVTAELRCCKS